MGSQSALNNVHLCGKGQRFLMHYSKPTMSPPAFSGNGQPDTPTRDGLICDLNLSQSFPVNHVQSKRTSTVAAMFGLDVEKSRRRLFENISLQIRPGDLIYVSGPSGGGKSVLLRLIARYVSDALDLDELIPSADVPAVDCFSLSIEQTMCLLSRVGLADVWAILAPSNHLSEGQRYRLRLALAFAQRPRLIIADEFCSILDRVTARVVAHNLRKLTRLSGVAFVVATAHEDLLEDLDPDVMIFKPLDSQCVVRRRQGAGVTSIGP